MGRKAGEAENRERQWDRLLRIRTSGRDDSGADRFRYPYEPTPYCILERLASSPYMGKKHVLLDYGCGKGRVSFYLSHETGCRSIGVEYDRKLWRSAEENRRTAVSGRKTEFVEIPAETYPVPEEVDRCYFFNPFSIELLEKVMMRIQESLQRCPRKILLFFYYPSEEYLSYLTVLDSLTLLETVDCRDLFPGGDSRECIAVFEMS